jgi:murein DD-endopeptidase MepM/ murein hydrolase activator NlpD
MASENVRERKEKRHFTLVFMSGTDSRQTRTFSASLWKLIGILAAGLLVLTALITAVIVYTPIGSRLPISNPRLETEYGRQIGEIRERMNFLFGQLNTLRAYNIRLRKALGEEISPADSSLIASGQIDTSGLDRIGSPPPAAEASSRAEERGAPPDPGIAGQADGAASTGATVMTRAAAGAGEDIFPLSSPTEGYVTREFTPGDFHYGIDYAAKEGTPVLAAAPGFVIFSGWTTGEGNMMMISHPGGYVTVYKHNKSLLKSTGDAVRRGEVVAQVGSTGMSTAPHLHFEVWKDGIAQDAENFLLTTQ